MNWLKEHGLISSYADYCRLPLAVLEDARMLAEAESIKAKREANAR